MVLIRVSSYPIIKRRIAWLIGKWVLEECTPPTNPLIWEILAHLLRDRGPSTDTVVRLTAATALKDCIDVSFGHAQPLNSHSICVHSQLIF
jgi:hypothetical protein